MPARFKGIGSTTFASLALPNYRLYLSGQGLSLIGTWMQTTAQSWLVLSLTGSATKLGVIVALQTLPVLLFGAYGGVVADRVNKRRTMIMLQSLMGVQALALGLLCITGTVRYWEIGVLALMLGFNNVFENPTRQSFMLELVGPEHLRNAVSLNSTAVSLARTVGPAIAGLIIAWVGEGWCFMINAASFVAVVSSLIRLDKAKLNPTKPTPRARGQLREGLLYIGRTRSLLIPLLMMFTVGCLAFEFQVSLPYMASRGLNAGASAYGFMLASMSAGSVVGALFVANRGKIGSWPLVTLAAAFGVSMALAAIAPSLAVELLVLTLVGAFSIAFMSIGNTTLQLRAAPEMRGRVLSFWFISFQGSTPIGGPIVGAVMSAHGARWGLGLGALACLVVAALGALTLRWVGAPMSGTGPPTYRHPLPDVETDAPDGEMPSPVGSESASSAG